MLALANGSFEDIFPVIANVVTPLVHISKAASLTTNEQRSLAKKVLCRVHSGGVFM